MPGRNHRPQQVDVNGSPLRRPICGDGHVSRHVALLGIGWLSFLNIGWFGHSATTFTCADCGHILWFRPRR